MQRLFDDAAGPTYTIVFDGGALGNPGKGYGSYKIFSADRSEVAHERCDFGDNVTNNQAEYRTLIAALDHLTRIAGSNVSSVRVQILSDSMLVVQQLLGKWKIKNDGLRVLHGEASGRLQRFHSRSLTWHDRSNSVAILGH